MIRFDGLKCAITQTCVGPMDLDASYEFSDFRDSSDIIGHFVALKSEGHVLNIRKLQSGNLVAKMRYTADGQLGFKTSIDVRKGSFTILKGAKRTEAPQRIETKAVKRTGCDACKEKFFALCPCLYK